MAAQEIIESLSTDSGEESDGETEGVRLVVQLIRLQSLLAKGTFDYHAVLVEGIIVYWFFIFSIPSTGASQIAVADARTAGRSRAAPIPSDKTCDSGGGPIACSECCVNGPGTGSVGQGKSR